jgi:hypothetical protein
MPHCARDVVALNMLVRRAHIGQYAPVSEREVWRIQVVIEATEDQADQALEAIERALCPDENHPGYCEVPWTTMQCRFADLDEDERQGWQAAFDEERRRAREAGAAGA